ncbi:MAG: peptidase C15 [Cyanobacteria bacterium P01_G01_bin.54]
MSNRLLLTAFQTWLPQQVSNASDDLLGLIGDRPEFKQHHYLRKLPVDTMIASQQACAQIDQLQPQGVVCCGMAEGRSQLSLEAQAREPGGAAILETTLPITQLVKPLSATMISYDAGQFVCEGLYFHVLRHLKIRGLGWALFVHVPLLTPANQEIVVEDFVTLLNGLQQQ